MNVAIYPTKEELCGSTEAYLTENHREFYEKFTEAKWTVYYTKYIYPSVSFFYF